MPNLLSQLGSFYLLEKHAVLVNRKILKNARKNRIPNPRVFNMNDLKKLQKKILNKTFKFDYLYAKTIPKPGNPLKKRPLSIPTPQDRVVYSALNSLVKPTLIDYLNKAPSYGVLKKRGVHGAFREIKKLLDDGHHFVLKVDIKNFFNEIDKDILYFILSPKINDSSINDLIIESLKFEYKSLPTQDDDKKLFPSKYYGIAQGNSLSPLFADVYLKLFDMEMKRSNVKIVRYVDDMIMFAKSRKELYPAYIKIRNSIKVFHLKIDKYNVGKCVATHISKHPEFLGIDIGPNGILTIRGERVHKFKQKLWGLIDRYHHKDTTKKEKIEQINYLIEGWSGAYSMCDKTYLGALYSKLNKIVENSCRSRLKSGLINTNEYNYLIKNIRKFTLIKNKKSRGINRK